MKKTSRNLVITIQLEIPEAGNNKSKLREMTRDLLIAGSKHSLIDYHVKSFRVS